MTESTPEPAHAQLVVIGGGPGGYSAAFKAAELGLQVTLVDKEENPGGVCLYRGCIPSKALLHAAAVIEEAAVSTPMGLTFAPPTIDVDQLRTWKNEVVQTLTKGLGTKVGRLKLTYLQATAQFLDAHTLLVTKTDGTEARLTFEQAIVATGSRPIALPGAPTSPRIMDSTGALDLADVPARLLVVGGGYIGLELGTAYAALGSKVSVVEMTGELLPGCDRDLVSVLKRKLDKRFEAIDLKTKVVSLEETETVVLARLENHKGEAREEHFERVLVAIGRRPNSEGVGFENTAIKLDPRGFVEVDGQRRTAEPHIYAIGDLTGDPMLAHKAYAEAHVAAEAAAGHKSLYDPRGIPAVVFTNPDIAWCGLTETLAAEQGLKVKVAKLPWRSNGRSLTLGDTNGMTKVLVDPASDRVLGVAVAGRGAGELIAEGVLALEMAAVGEDLARTIHPHPTLSETLYEAAQMLGGK